MFTIQGRNVNHTLLKGISGILHASEEISPRGARTFELTEPCTTTYLQPTERVLFYKERDANPFFHLFEALWMLAGRKDVKFLSQFNSNIANYSDNGMTFHGAYGYRLRRHHIIDQLEEVVKLLKKDNDTRQAVLQIWDSFTDLGAVTKDIPCNDLIFLKIRNGKLNMTVCCRSNDMIWGAYGANVVHFSMIQEYIAAGVGVEVGVYNQVSDSFHVYPDNILWGKIQKIKGLEDPYERLDIYPFPLVRNFETFKEEVEDFCENGNLSLKQYKNPFLSKVARPMLMTWNQHKNGKNGAYTAASLIRAADWRLACLEWLARRGDTIEPTCWGFSDSTLFTRGYIK